MAIRDLHRASWIVNLARVGGAPKVVDTLRGGAENLGKVAGQEFGIGHGVGGDRRGRHCKALEETEDEGLLPLFVQAGNVERAAGRNACLVAAERSVGAEIRRGVEIIVGVELVRRAVEAIGSRLGDHVHYVTRAPSILGCERVVLNLEFLNRVHGGHIDDRAPFRVGVPGAIQKEGRRSKETAGEVHERNVLICVVGAVAAAAQQLLAFRGVAHGRVQGGETVDVAHIQGQFHNLLR